MSKIEKVIAREILDSRGRPTLEAEVYLSSGDWGRAAVPSGASTGAHEAHELRDGDKKRYNGKGVLKAVKSVTETIAPKVKGMSIEDLEAIDKTLIDLDGTATKSNLGANAVLGVSLAAARAKASLQKKWVFELWDKKDFSIPVPLMNVLNGGAHANNGLDVQEFMVVPVINGPFSESLRAGCEVFEALKGILDKKGFSTAVGDEGGFAPKLTRNQDALDLLSEAIEKSGYKLGEDFLLALDVAATELFDGGTKKYTWEGKTYSSEELVEIYSNWAKKYPIISIEDGLAEDDWAGWAHLNSKMGSKIQIVGDDLFVTNPVRIERGIKEKSANSLLVKANQIGTLTETKKAIDLANKSGFTTVISHRSGETEDGIIADLGVGLGCHQIKTGSLCRGERTAKYNQLLRISERLGSKAQYSARRAFLGR